MGGRAIPTFRQREFLRDSAPEYGVVRPFEPRIRYRSGAYWTQSGEPHFDRERFVALVHEKMATVCAPGWPRRTGHRSGRA